MSGSDTTEDDEMEKMDEVDTITSKTQLMLCLMLWILGTMVIVIVIHIST